VIRRAPEDDLQELRDELEIALADALDGLPPGPRLYKRLSRIVDARLQTRLGHGYFRGVDRAKILISEGLPGSIQVELQLHRGPAVRHVRLSTVTF
jgi:hypothetical protein